MPPPFLRPKHILILILLVSVLAAATGMLGFAIRAGDDRTGALSALPDSLTLGPETATGACRELSGLALEDHPTAWRQRLWWWPLALAGVAALALGSFLGAFVLQGIRREEGARQELAQALADRDMLFREINHRIKNNFQVVSSLLTLEAARFDHPKVKAAFYGTIDRIQSMAAVHETLYRRHETSILPMADYLAGLCDSLAASHATCERGIALEVRADDCCLPLDAALPVALIASEVVCNALKHAFPDGRPGRITVAFTCTDGRCTLMIGDDGVGLPPEPVRNRRAGIGQQLVRLMGEHIGGAVTFERSGGGTTFRLNFPAPV